MSGTGTPNSDSGTPNTDHPGIGGEQQQGTPDGSFSAPHPVREEPPILVGPATEDQRNAVRPDLPVVACWRLNDIRFDFDSCFVRPEAHNDFRLLAALRKNHPGAVISIFGHADPVGNDAYNKQISGRRALAVYAILIRDVSRWETLWTQDNWGKSQLLVILDSLGYSPAEDDGIHKGAASAALKAFQADNPPLTAHGYNNAATRKKLFRAYMDRLCGPDLELDKNADFLARGSDANQRGDVQGCSEFNPLLILSEAENTELSKPANHEQRNAANVPNRRVLIFLFRPGTRIDPADWPCPKADTKAIAACEARFYSNGRDRLKAGPERRFYARGHKTFACRFYDRLSNFSPCENPGDAWVLRVLAAGRGSIPNHRPLADQPFTLEGTGSGAIIKGRTDNRGFLRANVVANTPTMTLKIAGNTITLNGGALHQMVDDNAVKDRLYNMGYGDADYNAWTDQILTDAIKAFQKDHQLNETGVDDDATRDKIKEMHGS